MVINPKFTPGPYVEELVNRGPDKGYVTLSCFSQKCWQKFAKVVLEVDGDVDPEGQANINLFKHAPDLFWSLAKIILWAKDNPTHPDLDRLIDHAKIVLNDVMGEKN